MSEPGWAGLPLVFVPVWAGLALVFMELLVVGHDVGWRADAGTVVNEDGGIILDAVSLDSSSTKCISV